MHYKLRNVKPVKTAKTPTIRFFNCYGYTPQIAELSGLPIGPAFPLTTALIMITLLAPQRGSRGVQVQTSNKSCRPQLPMVGVGDHCSLWCNSNYL